MGLRFNFSRLLLLVAFVVIPVTAYLEFKDRIPNGNRVPDPCRANQYWAGVGHNNVKGGGSRNPFGLAFDAAGKTWTRELCEADSDEDGISNGNELGDPDCTWTNGTTPARVLNITHPGICDPYEPDGKCGDKNDWVNCEQFKCDSINEPDTRSLEIKFNNTAVPKDETTYECMMYDLPADQDYHITAATPIIDNPAVVHHIIVWACNTTRGVTFKDSGVPYHCGMTPDDYGACLSMLVIWTIGIDGICMQDGLGVKFGLSGFKKVALQIHWNNPFYKTGMTDSSGIKLYYEPKVRPNDIINFLVGQSYLKIEPSDKRKEFGGGCAPECTQIALRGPVQVTGVLNHMHYKGREAVVKIYRNGSLYKEIGDDPEYKYDSPKQHKIDPPLQLLPGDDIQLTCVFSGEGASEIAFYGDATSDEMCFSFLTIHPAINLRNPICSKWKSIPECRIWQKYSVPNTPVLGCNIATYQDDAKTLVSTVKTSCQRYDVCTPECMEATEKLYDHPCFKGEMWDFLRLYDWTLYELHPRLQSCDFEIKSKSVKCPVSAGNKGVHPTIPAIMVVVAIGYSNWG